MQRTLTLSLACLLLSPLTACRKRSEEPIRSSLRGISYIYTIPGSSVKSDINEKNQVSFYIDIQGAREPVVSVDDAYKNGSVKGLKTADNMWHIQWMGVTIGEKRGADTEICGPRFGYSEICDATFIQRTPNSRNGKNLLILGLLDKGLEQMPVASAQASSSKGLKLTDTITKSDDTFVDIAKFATNEVNQNGTGTCLYNSTTGIVEWYRNQASGKIERLSAPYFLAKLFEESFTGEVGAVNETSNMKNAAPDDLLPTQQTYNQFTAFQPAYQYSKQQADQIDQSKKVVIPAIKGTKLFMLSQPAMGEFGAQGVSDEQMNSVYGWLKAKKTPVHLFHYYYNTGIWHAVMALGWDDQRQLIKIKDSLSQSGKNGQWRSIASYQAMSYGAVGTEASDSSTNSTSDSSQQNPITSTTSTGSQQTPPSNTSNNSGNQGSTPSPQPQSNNSLVSELDWLAVIQGSNMYVYISKDVSDVSIRGYGDQWLTMPYSYVPQPGLKTIRGIYINRASWNVHTTVDVRVIYKGQYVAARVPIQFR
jgi:hypothetical protein